MPNIELEKYIKAAQSQGATNEVIKDQLVKSGWAETDVINALTPTSPEGNINLPPPPVPHFGMWITFQYIILYISLYMSATALGGILHHGVNQLFQDPLETSRYSSGFENVFLNFYIASIVVGFPIFAFLFIILKRQVEQKPAVRNIKARKILIYITLVGTFLIMIGHLIGTIIGLLGGNLTIQSFAHLGVTFFVAGSIFFYLLNEVREDRKN